jgi:hypothetical protein
VHVRGTKIRFYHTLRFLRKGTFLGQPDSETVQVSLRIHGGLKYNLNPIKTPLTETVLWKGQRTGLVLVCHEILYRAQHLNVK